MSVDKSRVSNCCIKLPLKVHLVGGEGVGWALDQDIDLTRRAFQHIASQVELVPLEKADVVHAVWDAALDRIGDDTLAGKFVVCNVCTNVYKMLEATATFHRCNTVGLWVTQTKEASEAATRLRWSHFYVPYAVDTGLFGVARGESAPGRDEERQGLGVKSHEFLVGNFMRDSLGSNLDLPKPEKGAELFLEVVCGLKARGVPVRVLLAGPRRHWLRRRLSEREVPFTFLGQIVDGDDIGINILPLKKIAALYHILDLCLITSRHEGGPRAVLEAAASRTPVLSTPVGLAIDVLGPSCLYRAVDEGIEKACSIAREGYAVDSLDFHYRAVVERHSLEAVADRYAEMYRELPRTTSPPVGKSGASQDTRTPMKSGFGFRQWFRRGCSRLMSKSLPGLGIRICLWHEFHKPPYGGGNQFMLALQKSLRALGVDVVNNQLDDSVDVHICNALWFDPRLIEELVSGRRCRIIHRLDGLVHVARGLSDRSIDDRAYEFNRRFATATVMQSEWCLKQAIEMGYCPKRHVIIRNASDPTIFFPSARESDNPRIRIIATSWSDNPMKGARLYKAMESELDWLQFDFTFVGRTQERFDRIRIVPPMASAQLAHELREHDIYITASRNEACSNALIEALSCGLPALYLNDSGNPEVVGYGGLPFDGEADVISQLLRLSRSRKAFRQCIHVEKLHDVAVHYLELAKEIMQRHS